MTGFDLRLKILGLFIGVLLVTLTGRLWVLQLTRWIDFQEQALQNRTSIVTTPAPRGLIYDRHGRVLAENRPNWRLVVTPAMLPNSSSEREDIVRCLASILRDHDVSTTDVRNAIDEACASGRSVKPTPLGSFADNLPLEIVAQIEERSLDLPGVEVAEYFQRHYPYGDLAAHVIGYARPINSEEYERWRDLKYPVIGPDEEEVERRALAPWDHDPVYRSDSNFGKSGVEAGYELDRAADPIVPILKGRRGMLVYEVDVHNRPIRLLREERVPEQGAGVYLTLDLDLQGVAEEAVEAAVGGRLTGAAVLMDVNTGGVLAMASKPSVDPNKWVRGFSSEEYQRYANDPRHPFMNKAISGTYPPGSIFKMVTALAGLETTDVSPHEAHLCRGRIGIRGGGSVWYHNCWTDHNARIDMWEGIAQSCDIYFYELVRKAGTTSDAIAEYGRLFGMGSATNCGLPAEAEGRVPDREWKADYLDEDWYTGDTFQYSIGQSFLRVTPLQMAVMTAAIANGGRVISPRLVRKIEWPQYMQRGPTLFQAEEIRRLEIDPDHFRIVQEGMKRVVYGERGTARALQDLDFTVAGKTGSAQFDLDKKTHAWFVAYAPYENPRFAVSVLITEAGSGGEIAGPVAATILEAAMEKYGDGSTLDEPYLVPDEPLAPELDVAAASEPSRADSPHDG